MTDYGSLGTGANRGREGQRDMTMEMPLFPLNVVLFPGMVLPLHIFEPRYLEMINHCIEANVPFGVVLIQDGQEVGAPAVPHKVGTAARIKRVERLPDGKLNVTVLGAQRFRIVDLDFSHNYLTAHVRLYPVINGSTQAATVLAHKVRPKIVEYVDLLGTASNTKLKLDRLPEDPTALALLVGIALQMGNEGKQKLLELPGVPEILDRERYLLSCEILLLQHMIKTQSAIQQMGTGPTGYVFPN